MSDINQNRELFIEDKFDLDEFKQDFKAKSWEKKSQKKNKKLINFLSVIIMILSVFIAYLAYGVIQYQIDLWSSSQAIKKAQEIITEPPAD